MAHDQPRDYRVTAQVRTSSPAPGYRNDVTTVRAYTAADAITQHLLKYQAWEQATVVDVAPVETT